MPDTPSSNDDRIEEIARQVCFLRDQVDELTRLVHTVLDSQPHPAPAQVLGDGPPVTAAGESERVSVPLVLSSVAAVCFLLVVALILRTVVDNGVINRAFGAGLGVGYAVLLIAYGYYTYEGTRRRASVFVTCGAFLVFSIVFETHSRFAILPTPLAYLLLGLTLFATAGFGLHSGFSSPLWAGVLGASLTGLGLEFPDPHYLYLAALLLAANGAAYAASRISRSRSLIWFMVIVTACFWLLWAIKVRIPLLRHQPLGAELTLAWMLPALFVFGVGYLAMVICSVTRVAWSYRILERVLPVLNAALAYAVAYLAIQPWAGREDLIAAAIAVVAAAHLVVAAWLAARGSAARAGVITSFTSVAAGLLAVSLRSATGGNSSATLLIWACAAIVIWVLSEQWRNHDVRFLSYALQLYTCACAIAFGSLSAVYPLPGARTITAILLAAVCAGHFAARRYRPPIPATGLVEKIDPGDALAVLVFIAGLVYAFGAARMGLYTLAVEFFADAETAFQCGQSMLVNLGALALAFIGLARTNRELLGVAMAIAFVGALKVFGYDLMKTHGVPLVLNVFVFGVTAGMGSLIWSRWQTRVGQPDERPVDSGEGQRLPGPKD